MGLKPAFYSRRPARRADPNRRQEAWPRATTVGTGAYDTPVVAVSLGWLILDESLTPGLLTGGC